MPASAPMRLARAMLGNALVWGVGWFSAVLALGAVDRIDGGPPWLSIVQSALRAGVLGALASVAFSVFIRLRFRGRSLSGLSWVRFGIGGGLVIGLFVPLFITVARALSGDPLLPLAKLVNITGFGLFFGGAAAAASLKLAQIADRVSGSGRIRPPRQPSDRYIGH